MPILRACGEQMFHPCGTALVGLARTEAATAMIPCYHLHRFTLFRRPTSFLRVCWDRKGGWEFGTTKRIALTRDESSDITP